MLIGKLDPEKGPTQDDGISGNTGREPQKYIPIITTRLLLRNLAINIRGTAKERGRRVKFVVFSIFASLLTLVLATSMAVASAPKASAATSSWFSGNPGISQGYGCTPYTFEPRVPSCRGGHFHTGIDFQLGSGSPLVTPFSAQVISIGVPSWAGPYAPKLRLDDGHIVLLAHVQRVYVRVNQRLTPGDRVADVGSRGNSTGPHLHFEVDAPGGSKNINSSVDPTPWLSPKAPTPVTRPQQLPTQQLVFFDNLATPGRHSGVNSIYIHGPNQYGVVVGVCVATPGHTTIKRDSWWAARTYVDTYRSGGCQGPRATGTLWIDPDKNGQYRCLIDTAPYSDWSCKP